MELNVNIHKTNRPFGALTLQPALHRLVAGRTRQLVQRCSCHRVVVEQPLKILEIQCAECIDSAHF